MKKIKTSSGFKCEVNEEIIKDWRFVKALAQMSGSDEMDVVAGATKTVTLLLGEKGEQELCRHVEKDGVASVVDIMAEVKEIMSQISKK